jgi:putative hydrolase of the HAD superfamily
VTHSRIDAVIFDLDDTLIDWANPAIGWRDFTDPKACNIHAYLVEAGYELPDEAAFCDLVHALTEEIWDEAKKTWSGAYFTKVLRRTLSALEIDSNQVDLEALMQVYDWTPMPGVEAFEDAEPVLAELRRRGYKIGLITNSFLPMWMRDVELRHYGFLDYFDARLASGDVGYLKPHPAIFEEMLALLETAPERTLFVGDRPANDIAGANEVGMISVLMKPAHLDRPLDGVKPDFTIERLSALLPLLEEMEAQ